MIADEEVYRRIVEAIPEGIWIADPQGQTVFCTHRMAELLGTDVATIARQSCFDYVFPEDLAEARSLFAKGFGGNLAPFDFRLRRCDGSAIYVSISSTPMQNERGELTGILGLFTDITERKRVEESLRESEERFRNMADTAPVMIWVAGCEKGCTFFNKVWLEFTGRTMEQELGDGWTEGVHNDDLPRCLEMYSTSFDAHKSFQMEYRLRRADGEYRWLLDTGVPRLAPSGIFAGYIGSCTDITDVKRAQEEALGSQKLESLGQLATGIAHDFNNLLGGILASTELALEKASEDSLPVEELSRIKMSAVRGGEIVRQLLTYGGEDGSVHHQVIDLSVVVGEMLQLLTVSISKYVTLETALGEGLPGMWGNPAQIRQVVMNLVTNASDAIGDRPGVIHVTTALVKVPGGVNLSPGDYLKLEVSDTGSGMTPEVQSRIFDPFFTTKSTGHGLGLAAVQGIVRSHSGAVNVTSAIEKGARFEVLLPLTNEAIKFPPSVAAQPSAKEVARGVGAVLVVEDEDSLRIAVSKMLRRKGITVMEASHGQSAVELFRANDSQIAVVLLDITLPGMSGLEVFAELRRIRQDVKVILSSAFDPEAILPAVGVKGWAFIRKPYHIHDLMSLVMRGLSPNEEDRQDTKSRDQPCHSALKF